LRRGRIVLRRGQEARQPRRLGVEALAPLAEEHALEARDLEVFEGELVAEGVDGGVELVEAVVKRLDLPFEQRQGSGLSRLEPRPLERSAASRNSMPWMIFSVRGAG
jgi:hypothetical protein